MTRLRRAQGRLGTAALARMERDMPWFADLSAHERSLIASVVQAGIGQFINWYADPADSPSVATGVFGVAPRAFAVRISLQQTVAMIRLGLEVVEENLVELLGEEDAAPVVRAVTRYGREIAFAAAEVYARAAEQRGAWDARLEALVVDSVLRGDSDETVESRASALGWAAVSLVTTLLGPLPEDGSPIEAVHRVAHEHGRLALCAIQGDRLVVLLGHPAGDPSVPQAVVDVFGPGVVVASAPVAGLNDVPGAAAAALAAYRSTGAWTEAPRLVDADELLPERVLAGDDAAARTLTTRVFDPLVGAGGSLLETTTSYLDSGSSLERSARDLFVHVNTVRYRLKRVADVTGLDPTDPREGYVLRIALTVGRLCGLPPTFEG